MKIEYILKRVMEYDPKGFVTKKNIITPTALEVGWGMAGIIRKEEDKRLFTRGLGPSYAVIGESREGDALLAHMYARTDPEREEEMLNVAIAESNQNQRRKISLGMFTLETIRGHNMRDDLFIADISYQNGVWRVEKYVAGKRK